MTCQEYTELKDGPRDFADLLPSERRALAVHYWDCEECRNNSIAGMQREWVANPLSSLMAIARAQMIACADSERVDPEL